MFDNNINLFACLLDFDRGGILKCTEYFLGGFLQIQFSATSEFTDFFVPMDFNPIVFAELLKNNIQLLVIELILSVFPGNIILCVYVVHGFFITLVVI